MELVIPVMMCSTQSKEHSVLPGKKYQLHPATSGVELSVSTDVTYSRAAYLVTLLSAGSGVL
jgi:hypothetical protein